MSDADLEALYYDPLCRRVVDVFAEAALAKLFYLFSKDLSLSEIKNQMTVDLRGELTL